MNSLNGLFAAIAMGLVLSAGWVESAHAQQVTIANGVLEGSVNPATGIRSFKGIPFAAPPVGAFRWKAPQPVPKWTGVRSATQFGPRCMQQPVFNDVVFRSNGMSEDYALLDHVAALRWVRENIAAFGGDPAKVTIAGESAGSISVSAIMASPLSKDLIAGAIGESGAMIKPTLPPAPLAEAEQQGQKFAESVSVPSIAALRAMSADELLKAGGR